MLIKKQLLTIKPVPPMAKDRKQGQKYFVYADVFEFEGNEPILAVFVYNYRTNNLVFRFFSDKKNYITYDEEGWGARKFAYEGWDTNSKTHYYRKSDTKISKFLDTYSEGLRGVNAFIEDYNYQRRQITKTNRQRRIDSKIESVPDLSKRLEEYCDEKIFGTYLFMTKKDKRGKRHITCSHCGGKYQLSKAKHREEDVCKKCGRQGTYYLQTYRGPIDKCKLLVCNKTVDGKYTAYQWFKVEREYIKDLKPTYTFDDYFYCFENEKGMEFYKWNYSFWNFKQSNYWYGYDEVYLYTENLEATFGKCIGNVDVSLFETVQRPTYMFDLLLNLRKFPAAEYFVKLKLFALASNYRLCEGVIERNFGKALGVSAQYLTIFQKLDVNDSVVNFLRKSPCFLKEEYVSKLQEILPNTSSDGLYKFMTEAGMSPKKAITYVFNQMKRLKRHSGHIMHLYIDYMGMSKQMNVELTSKGLKYPPDIKKAHDQIMERVQIKESRTEAYEFKMACRELYKTFISWHDDKYIVVRPTCRADFLREGQILSHCVGKFGGYYKNHKCGKAVILFIRSVKNTDKPMYTLELDCKSLKIKQLYGKSDSRAPAEVYDFVKKYAKEINKLRKEKEKAA